MKRLPFLFRLLLVTRALSGLGAGFENIDRPAAGALLTPRFATGDGRMAIMAWHNGLLYSIPEVPGSLAGSTLQIRSWNFADPTNPVSLDTYGVTRHPVLAHGFFYRNNLLVLGDNFLANQSFEATPTYGVNLNQPFSEIDPLNGTGGHGVMYHPFYPTPSYTNYFPSTVPAQLRYRDPQTGIWQTTATWDHLGLTNVPGYPFIVGNLLIFASDNARAGIAIYDISDLNNPVLLSTVTDGGAGGYWPALWGGDGRLYMVWAYRQEFNEAGNGFRVIDITDPADPQWVIDSPLPNDDQTMYVMFQDEFAFMGNHKIDMRTHEVVLTFPTEAHDTDSSQFALPLGNLVLFGGYGTQQGISVWVHQEEADTRPPEVGYHLPVDGQTNYPLHAPITLLIHDVLETTSIVNGTSIILRPVGGVPVAAQFALSFDGVLTFTPDAPLLPNTSYEVLLDGIEDAAGNAMEPYSFTFSTGSEVSGNAAPVISALNADADRVDPGNPITLTATASDDPAQSLEYRFDAGDGRPKTAWSGDLSAAFIYNTPGHYRPTVQVRDPLGAIASRQTGINVYPLPAGPLPTHSGPVAVDETNRRIWNVNPDNNSVSVVNADTLGVIQEIPVPADPRGIALDADGNAWVTCHDADRVLVLDGTTGGVLAEYDTGYGSAPFAVALSPDNQFAYVTLYGSGHLLRFDVATRLPVGAPLPLGPTPRAIAIRADSARLLVTRFISPRNHAEVWEVNTATFTLSRTLRIPKFGGETHRDGTANSRGVANYLSGILYGPEPERAWVTATKQNTERGTLFNADQTHDTVQRNLLVELDLNPALLQGSIARDIDLDNSDSASGLAISPHLNYLAVSLQGTNEVLILDLLETAQTTGLGSMVTRHPVGAAPQGAAFDPATGRLLVHAFLDRSLTVVNLSDLFHHGGQVITEDSVPVVNNEILPEPVLTGKRIFYHADSRMSSEQYISCASCHLDGGSDGRIWDFTQRGEGLRNTTELRGRGGMAQGNVHWSGNFDEIQDFENDIRIFFGGSGLMSDEDFAVTSAPLGPAKAGLSAELDALAAYVASLDTATLPRSPHRLQDGSLSLEAEQGRQTFLSMNCAACHGGEHLTDSPSGVLHDVGTLRTTSGQRLGETLPGIDTPTLRGVWANAPYFHDGSAATLADVFTVAGGTVIQAEEGQVTGGSLHLPGGLDVLINFDNTVIGGLARLESGGSLTFENVDGGNGGMGAIELRYSSGLGSDLMITVNGVAHPLTLASTGDTPSFRNVIWQTARVESVAFTAGPTNTIVLGGTTNRVGIDHLTISTPDDLAAASAHRSVPAEEREALIQYLLSLDGSPVEVDAPEDPTVALSLTPGQSPSDPVLEVLITFSEPVNGLTFSDLSIGGNAGWSEQELAPIQEGTVYRLRLAGFSTTGHLTVSLPAGQVAALDDGADNLASGTLQRDVQLPDDLASLSDSFDDPATLSDWLRNDLQEGWNADKLEHWDIGTSRAGHMRLTPRPSSWYQDWTGALAYKEVTGDFVVTTTLDVTRRDGAPGRPTSPYSLAGLMIRSPRNVTQAAPVPDPGPGTVLPWPAPAVGDPDHYVTDWQPGTENHLFFGYGYADAGWGAAADTWQILVGNTLNSASTVYGSQVGIPAATSAVTLRIARRDDTFLLLRQHPGGEWIVENRFVRPDFPDTLQIGITAQTDWTTSSTLDEYHHNRTVQAGGNPDLVADVDAFELARPPVTLTEAQLLAAPVTGGAGPAVMLASTALPSTLGPAAQNDGQSYADWLTAHFTPAELVQHNLAAHTADPDGDQVPNLIDYLTDGEPWGGFPAHEFQLITEDGTSTLQVARNPQARGYRLIIEASSNLFHWETLAETVNGAPPTGPGFVEETAAPLPVMTIVDPHPDPNIRFYRLRAMVE